MRRPLGDHPASRNATLAKYLGSIPKRSGLQHSGVRPVAVQSATIDRDLSDD
jgi:hypothetical protein